MKFLCDRTRRQLSTSSYQILGGIKGRKTVAPTRTPATTTSREELSLGAILGTMVAMMGSTSGTR